MFYVKTIYLFLYVAFGVCLLFFLLAAAVGSKPILFVILIIYTFLWWVMGGAAFIRPNKSMKYFIAVDLIAFLFFFYDLIHQSYFIVWHGVMKGQAIKPGNPLYYRLETIPSTLLFVIGLALEAIVSYTLLKKSMQGGRSPDRVRDSN